MANILPHHQQFPSKMMSGKGVQKFHTDDASPPNLRSSGGSVFFFACKSFGGIAANLATLPDNLLFL